MRSRTPLWLAATSLVLDLLLSTHLAHADALDDAIAAHCTPDPRLGETAALLLREHDPIDREALRNDAERHGVMAPSVRGWVARGGIDAIATAASEWLAHQSSSAAWSRCAVARGDDTIAVAMVPRVATIAGNVTSAAVDEHRAFGITLPAGARAATCVLQAPDGTVSRCRFDDVTFPTPGPYTFQAIAETARGPLPFATWHVHATASAGDGATTLASATDSINAAARPNNAYQVLAAINHARARTGREALRSDPMLAELAHARATMLAAHGAVAHALRPDDSPVVRLGAAGITADRVAENVARAHTVGEASERLDASPSHRANRIDESVDAVGIGVATVGDDVYLVELFAAHPRIADARMPGNE